jgi:hypothetical protein
MELTNKELTALLWIQSQAGFIKHVCLDPDIVGNRNATAGKAAEKIEEQLIPLLECIVVVPEQEAA